MGGGAGRGGDFQVDFCVYGVGIFEIGGVEGVLSLG